MEKFDFAAFVKTERQKLIHYARARINETAEMDAEDIVHDVLVSIMDKADISMPLENLAAYIYRSVKNRMIDLFRTKKTMQPFDGYAENQMKFIDILQTHRPNALQQLQTKEGQQELFRALESLSEMERKVVVAHELDGLSFKSMAARWGVPQNTLLSYKARGIKKLKHYFLTLGG
ncbi:sigma-70 family RNA polymerase sigma factor [bacterium]|nr:sigma-70 family RNA polymerase sigma factor [bacterium]